MLEAFDVTVSQVIGRVEQDDLSEHSLLEAAMILIGKHQMETDEDYSTYNFPGPKPEETITVEVSCNRTSDRPGTKGRK